MSEQPEPKELTPEEKGDMDIPRDVRELLMRAAVSNGRINYYWLCDVWRMGRQSTQAEIRAMATAAAPSDGRSRAAQGVGSPMNAKLFSGEER